MSREDYEGMLPPSMRGGGMKLWGWVIPRGGKKKPVILSADTHDEISAICEEEIHSQGYFPLFKAEE